MHSSTAGSIKPLWLRPAAAVTVLLVHAGVVIGAPWPHDSDSRRLPAALTIQVVPGGQTAEAIEAPKQVQIAEVTAVEVLRGFASLAGEVAEGGQGAGPTPARRSRRCAIGGPSDRGRDTRGAGKA